MFDLSLAEVLFVVIVTLLVCKPEDLPTIIRQISKFFNTMKNYASELSKEFSDIGKEIDVRGDIKGHIRDLEGNIQEVYDVNELEELYEGNDKKSDKDNNKDA